VTSNLNVPSAESPDHTSARKPPRDLVVRHRVAKHSASLLTAEVKPKDKKRQNSMVPPINQLNDIITKVQNQINLNNEKSRVADTNDN